MTDFQCIEPAVDPANRLTFLLDWELTMKCNLDCSYCATGTYGGHDNSTRHPQLDACLDTIDFMYQYVDLYLRRKPKNQRNAILNVYGGESLYHPDILSILEAVRRKHSSYDWLLTVTTTTNAVVPRPRLEKISKLIDEFTVSYHTEASIKQKSQVRDNLLMLRDTGSRLKCVILMHNRSDLFEDAQKMIEWCQQNNIRYLPRQLDHPPEDRRFDYNQAQIQWFDQLYQQRSHRVQPLIRSEYNGQGFDLAAAGRSCCGGRSLCSDQNYRQRSAFVTNTFPDWYCSVNEFFLFIKQTNGEIFVNKDCKMSFDGNVGPIGNLERAQELLLWTRDNLDDQTLPVIQCKKSRCECGLCAPKAQYRSTFDTIMRKYRT